MFELLFTHPLWAYRTGVFAFASAWPLWLLVASILAAVLVIAATLWRRRQLGWKLLLPVGILQSLLGAAILVLLWHPVLNVERVRDRQHRNRPECGEEPLYGMLGDAVHAPQLAAQCAPSRGAVVSWISSGG